MLNRCGPNLGPCPADLKTRLNELEANTEKIQKNLKGLSSTFGKIQKEFYQNLFERHHIAYHRKIRPPTAEEKICPSPVAPPPCSALLRSDDIDQLCCKFKQLWPYLAQVMAERTVVKVENERLKRKLAKLKLKYEPDQNIDPLFKKKKTTYWCTPI